MDYEQKYKEMKARVLEVGRGYVKGLDYSNPRQIAEYIDPELKEESEDEKIRKELLQTAKESEDSFYMVMTPEKREKLIAWLEKQGESDETKAKTFLINKGYPIDANGIFPTYEEMYNIIKEGLEKQGEFADKVEPKFHEGDWVLNNVCLPVQINSIEDGMYIFTDGGALSVSFVDETYHLWNIQDDVKDGDVLYTSSTASHETFVFKNIDEKGNAKCYFSYDSEDGFCDGEYHFIGRAKDCKPATREQRVLLFRKMREKGYEWDAENKKLKKIERKPIEEVNGEDYGIDGLYHAQTILEQTLGNVEGYQSDDGILEHKCAISAVKKLSERKPAEWSEENTDDLTDFENAMMHIGSSFFGDNAGLDPNDTNTIKEQANLLLELVQKQEWSEEDEKTLADACIMLDWYKGNNWWKAQYIKLWLNSLKERVHLQPKQEWSEEDEKTLKSILTCIEYCYNEDTEAQYNGNHCVDPKRYKPMSDWLKSLRPQPQKNRAMIEKIINEIHRLKNGLDGYSASEGLDYIESYINIIQRE